MRHERQACSSISSAKPDQAASTPPTAKLRGAEREHVTRSIHWSDDSSANSEAWASSSSFLSLPYVSMNAAVVSAPPEPLAVAIITVLPRSRSSPTPHVALAAAGRSRRAGTEGLEVEN